MSTTAQDLALTGIQSIGGCRLHDYDYTIDVVQIPRILALPSGIITNLRDARLTTEYSGVTWYDYRLELNFIPKTGFFVPPKVLFASSDSSVATVDASGFVTMQLPGQATIRARGGFIDRSFKFDFVEDSGGAEIFKNPAFLPGTLGEHCENEILGRVTADLDLNFNGTLLTDPNAFENWVWNPDCWASSLDFTALSVWNSVGGRRRAGTLISDDVIVTANHYPLTVGARVYFLNAANQYFVYTVTDIRRVSGSDMQLCKLNKPVDASISRVKCFGAEDGAWRDKIWRLSTLGISIADNKEAYISRLKYFSLVSPVVVRREYFSSQTEDVPGRIGGYAFTTERGFHVPEILDTGNAHADTYGALINLGDSGHPNFLVINGQLALLGCHHSVSGGPSFSSDISLIRDAIHSFGGRQFTFIDLSSFPNV